MLKSALVAMTVMGCDCDARICVPVETAAAQWQSVAECETAAARILRGEAKLDYPLVQVRCEPAAAPEPLVAENDAPAHAPQGMLARSFAAAGQAGRSAYSLAATGLAALRDGALDAAGIAAETPRFVAALSE